MSCHDVAEALVDERLPRPPGWQAHLERCPECRALARLHAAAHALRLPEPPVADVIPRDSILGVVRRRQHRRRLVASTAATCGIAALVLLVTPRPRPSGPGDEASFAPVEQTVQRVRPESSEPASLGLLLSEVHGYTRTRPSIEDDMYRPFGALALWVRPPDATVESIPSP
jgi:hypothetical protein